MRLAIATAPARNSKRWSSSTIEWSEIKQWLASPAERKDCGGYLLGTLNGPTRTSATIVSRSALTLDIDHPEPGFIDGLLLTADFCFVAHTTWSSTPSEPRYRLIIPTDRPMAPDEYQVATQAFMATYGADQFDAASSRPTQYMFLPAAQKAEWFESWVREGPSLRVDSLLGDFVDDLSAESVPPRAGKGKLDPFEIEGVVGAFNRAYEDFQVLIDEYHLPYEPDGDRWHLVGARSVAGMGKISDGLVFSHHIHDPEGGVACSAFDLARLHLHGGLDEEGDNKTPVNRRKSHTAMLDTASIDARVTAEIVGVDFSSDFSSEGPSDVSTTDPNAWKLKFRLRARTGEMLDCIHNWDLIVANDPVFGLLRYNDMTMAIEVTEDLPWRTREHGGTIFSTIDTQALSLYIERTYGVRCPMYLLDALVSTTAQQTWHSPVRAYLEGLSWDGKTRIETCLPGVASTPYTRMVARKSLVAAVARVMAPGCKWDHTLVLYGPEGLGKTYWVDKMANGFASTLGRITDKDTLMILHRSWVMLADEGYSLRKADADVQKEFLTRTEDVFRMPYDRETRAHPRRCVFWSTTNDEVFLRRQEGNRRFLIVHCEEKVDFEVLTEEYVNQVWAEAVHLYRSGELLFLADEEAVVAKDERERFTEEDATTGLIEEFLDTLVPEDWDKMSPESRRMWITSAKDGMSQGTVRQERTCSTQIWVEVLGNPIGRRDRTGLLEITAALKKLPGWSLLPGRHRVPNYGPQAMFVRTDSLGLDLL